MRSLRPEYLYRPSQILRRALYPLRSSRTLEEAPWGMPLSFDPYEIHGRAMLTLGILDLRTCEMISRVVAPGDIVVDVGANIGMMTSLMAKRAGPTGRVYAFEPQPDNRLRLEDNKLLWKEKVPASADVAISSAALSSSQGQAFLRLPDGFGDNSGLATLCTKNSTTPNVDVAVQVDTFDNYFQHLTSPTRIKLVKIDVEGHEDAVLKGMQQHLLQKRIEYIIYEEHRDVPTPATEMLAHWGYRSFMIDRTFRGPRLSPVETLPPRPVGEPTNLIAMTNAGVPPTLQKKGWTCLRRSSCSLSRGADVEGSLYA